MATSDRERERDVSRDDRESTGIESPVLNGPKQPTGPTRLTSVTADSQTDVC